MIAPNFGLEDVFLRHERNNNNSSNDGDLQFIMKNGGSRNNNDNFSNAQPYVRYFHTSDGARNRNNYYNSSSLDPYQDSPPYVQHNGSSDLLGT